MKRKVFPTVSVIVNTFEGGKYLNETLKSVSELLDIVEIICVDNSREGTVECITSKYPLIKYLRSPYERSKNRSVNYAINHSHGEYLLLLDDDIVLTSPNTLISDLLKMQTNELGIISLSLVNKGERVTSFYGGFLGYQFIRGNKNLSIDSVKSINGSKISFPNGAAFFIKRRIWDLLGGYDASYVLGGDDTDIGIRCWMQGLTCKLYSKSIQIHTGIGRRKNNNYYATSFGLKLYAHLAVIFKSYSKCMIFVLLVYSIKQLLKAIKQSCQRKDMSTLKQYFIGLIRFFRNKDKICKDRNIRQTWRIEKSDKFLLELKI